MTHDGDESIFIEIWHLERKDRVLLIPMFLQCLLEISWGLRRNITNRISEEMKGKSEIRVKARDQEIQRSDLEIKKKISLPVNEVAWHCSEVLEVLRGKFSKCFPTKKYFIPIQILHVENVDSDLLTNRWSDRIQIHTGNHWKKIIWHYGTVPVSN